MEDRVAGARVAVSTADPPCRRKDKFGNTVREMGRVTYVGKPNDWRPVYEVTLTTLPE
jgi:hypothetical protein